MLNKFFKFLKGYVIINLYGQSTERFINICLKRNITLGSIKRCNDGSVRTSVSKRDFALLRPIAFKTHTKVRIVKKRGLYNLLGRYGKRYAFMAGAIICIAFFFVSSQYIWTVEINGVENTDYETLTSSLAKSGIYAGAKKNKIPNGIDIKNNILRENDNIAWAWVYIEGAKARVEVYEKIIPPMLTDRNMPCNIIAAHDGFIKNIIVKNGNALFKEGDTVSAGDVLISGTVPVFHEGSEERYINVHAMGSIEAYTSRKASGVYGVYYKSSTPTGRRKTLFWAEIFGKQFKFFLKESISFENYDRIENRHELKLPFIGYTGIAFVRADISETQIQKEPISLDTALEFAKNDLEAKISKELLYDSTLIDEDLTYNYIDDETISAELTMNLIEKIGTEVPFDNTDKTEE